MRIYLARFSQGLIIHTGMLAHPMVMTSFLNQMDVNHREHLRTFWGWTVLSHARVPSAPVHEDWGSSSTDVVGYQMAAPAASVSDSHPSELSEGGRCTLASYTDVQSI